MNSEPTNGHPADQPALTPAGNHFLTVVLANLTQAFAKNPRDRTVASQLLAHYRTTDLEAFERTFIQHSTFRRVSEPLLAQWIQADLEADFTPETLARLQKTIQLALASDYCTSFSLTQTRKSPCST